MFQDREQDRLEAYKKILKNSRTVFGEVIRQEEQEKTGTLSKEECVLAPVLNGFVLWVLQEAMKNKVKRLYFLARDGYFMYRCACIYCQKLQLPVECRYLSLLPLFPADSPVSYGFGRCAGIYLPGRHRCHHRQNPEPGRTCRKRKAGSHGRCRITV